MKHGRSILGVIIARGGSRGLPGKNLRELAGKPLVAWTVEAAAESRLLDRTVVSTEDPAIAEAARRYGGDVPFPRPAALARDDVPGVAPVLHALEKLPGYDLVVLLQATSPLRRGADIDAAIERCLERDAPSCVTVTECAKNPEWMFRLDDDRLVPVLPESEIPSCRQAMEPAYVLNGAVYVARVEELRRHESFFLPGTVALPMPRERSVDIDGELDLLLAEILLDRQTA